MNDERNREAAEQEERARRTLDAIMAGGNLPEEAQKLSDEFTDRQTSRFSQWVRSRFTRK